MPYRLLAVLAALKPLGVEPGKANNPETVHAIDGTRLADAARKVHRESVATWADPDGNPHLNQVFQPKGQMTLDPMVVQSACGPIGLPADQAVYPAISTTDGTPMNAQNDYIIRMSADEMPPAKAFWSVALYDLKNGSFIPNDHKEYSVGENGGFKLNEDGGIEIHIAAEKPEGVPTANWLPILRTDEGLDVVMRIYDGCDGCHVHISRWVMGATGTLPHLWDRGRTGGLEMPRPCRGGTSCHGVPAVLLRGSLGRGPSEVASACSRCGSARGVAVLR